MIDEVDLPRLRFVWARSFQVQCNPSSSLGASRDGSEGNAYFFVNQLDTSCSRLIKECTVRYTKQRSLVWLPRTAASGRSCYYLVLIRLLLQAEVPGG